MPVRLLGDAGLAGCSVMRMFMMLLAIAIPYAQTTEHCIESLSFDKILDYS